MSKPSVLGNISPMIPAGTDVAGAIAFYEEQLGFTTIYTEGMPITLAIVKRNSAEVFLYQNDDPHLAKWTTFRIQVENIEQLYEEFQAKGRSHVSSQRATPDPTLGRKRVCCIRHCGSLHHLLRDGSLILKLVVFNPQNEAIVQWQD